ncbi:MAG: hypothetical protein ACYC0H_01880 [Solirubrobacteraceae bacterium]
MRLRVVVACAIAVLSLGVAVAAASVGGNAQGIALATRQVKAYGKVPAETVVERGYVSINDAEGRTSFFQWQWGSGTLPRGWVHATEHAVVALHAGRIVWWRDDLTPPPCHVGLCGEQPVDVVINHKGAFFAFGTAARHTCYGRLRGSTPVSVGAPWSVVRGTFSAPVTHGSTVALTYSYPWGKSQTATETDEISSKTLLDQSGVIHISGAGQPSFTVRFTNGHPAKAPAAPKVNVCHG